MFPLVRLSTQVGQSLHKRPTDSDIYDNSFQPFNKDELLLPLMVSIVLIIRLIPHPNLRLRAKERFTA